jgi:hypothetical protein
VDAEALVEVVGMSTKINKGKMGHSVGSRLSALASASPSHVSESLQPLLLPS